MATKKFGKNSRQITASPGDVNKSPCVFCQRNVDDEVIFGKLYAIGDIQCHYFCVLLSCCLVQKGKDEEGLFGFLYPDILAEVERSKKHKCSYCNTVGATLGCAVSQCRKQFHLPCGREKNAVSLFHGNYKSFCQQHAPKQKIPEHIMTQAKARKKLANTQKLQQPNFSDLKELTPVKNGGDTGLEIECTETESVCVICYETVDGFPTPHTFWPSCCARDAWFHRSCLQRMALTAGMHYLKCPLCNDKDNFYDAVMAQGFYVPDRDAAWELEQNAFVDIYEREVSCCAEPCQCVSGRGYDESNTEWEIIMCIVCGDGASHLSCAKSNQSLGEKVDPVGENLGEKVNKVDPTGGTKTHTYMCKGCTAFVGDDVKLRDNIVTAMKKEEEAKKEVRRLAPIMPSRMSLRRTKLGNKHFNLLPSTSQNTQSSRLDLNLKPPRKQEITTKSTNNMFSPTKENHKLSPNKINNIFSPTKLIKDSLNSNMLIEDATLIESVKEKFKKPRPLSVKKKIVDDILDKYMSQLNKRSPKTKDKPREWISPKKVCDNHQGKKSPLRILFKPKDASPDSDKQKQKTLNEPENSDEITENSINNINDENTKHTTLRKSNENDSEEQRVSNDKNNTNDEINVSDKVNLSNEIIASADKVENEINNTNIPKNVYEDVVGTKVDKNSKRVRKAKKNKRKAIKLSNSSGEASKCGNKVNDTAHSKINNKNRFSLKKNQVNKDIGKQFNKKLKVYANTKKNISPNNKNNTSPKIKSIGNINNTTKKSNTEDSKDTVIVNDESSNSTFELPPEFIAETLSDDSVPILETPKLKTVDLIKDSIEISNNDQSVNINMFPVENNDKNPTDNETLLLKFYDSKESLNKNIDIDLENFKNQYLTEVDRNVKCNYNHKHIKEEIPNSPVKLRTAIDFAVEAFQKENCQKNNENNLKRKLEDGNPVPKKKKKVKKVNKKDSIQIVCSKETNTIDLTLDSKIKHKKIKRKIKKNKNSVRNIQVKIKWKKEELKLQITDGNRKKKKIKTKNGSINNTRPLNLKQYILKYSPETSSTNVISKPEGMVTPLKRKVLKQEKTPDKLKQTSIQNFFKKLN